MTSETLNYVAAREAEKPGTECARFLAPFEDWRKGREINAETLQLFKIHLAKTYRNPATRNRYMSAARAYAQFLRIGKRAQVTRDDIEDTLTPFDVPTRRPKVLSRAQVKVLLTTMLTFDAVPHPDAYRLFVLLALTTGARVGEIMALTGRSFDLENNVVEIWGSKTGRARLVPCCFTTTLQTLSPSLARVRGPVLKLCGPRGGPQAREWREIEAACGFKFEPRALRRTCESFAASSGKVPPLALAEWFGHGAAVAFKHYQAFQQQAQGEVLEQWMQAEKEFAALTQKVIVEFT
jgi:integrase